MNPEAFYSISYGMYVIGAGKNGQIANTLFQVTSDPPTVAVSINKKNLTHVLIQSGKAFSVSVLEQETPLKLIGHFGFKSGREINKLEGAASKTGKTGAAIFLDNTLAYLETELISQFDAGTHTVFIGKVIEAEVLKKGEPMTYAYYHQVKRGSSPDNAPTYQKKPLESLEVKEEIKMKKYVCKVCGYIYDPVAGDPDSGIPAGTAFEKIPDTWVCPVCGVGKDQFEEQK